MRRERALKFVLVVLGLLFSAGVYPMLVFVRQDPALAMMMSLYVTLGIFLLLAARNPSANRSLIAFAAWSSFAHAAIMTGQSMLSRLAFDVLDLQTMEFVLKTTLQSSGIKHGGWTIMRRPDAAVSPDDCKIAILVGSELRLYHLPADHVDDVSGTKTRN